MRIKLFKLISAALFMLPLLASGQYTLQFNQAKLVGSLETVPAGKVWKVEGFMPSMRLSSAVCTGSTSCISSSTESIILVNSTSVYMASSNSYGSTYGYNSTAAVNNSVYWLPEGTTLAAGTGVYRISVIEFNLITP
jgi:hypothetical protein